MQVFFFPFFLSWLDVLHRREYNYIAPGSIGVFRAEAHLSFFLCCVDVLHHAWSTAMLPVGAHLLCFPFYGLVVLHHEKHTCTVSGSTLVFARGNAGVFRVRAHLRYARREDATLQPTNPERRKLFVLTAMVALGSFYSRMLAWHSRKPRRHGVA